jgi:prepilin-type N-terminal cleavage/methylation domain-containing protein
MRQLDQAAYRYHWCAMKGPRYRGVSPRGFTLVEIVVVLLIFGVIVAMAAAITRGVTASQKRSLTTTRIAGIDAALVQFVQQQRRLPCPADGTLASTANNVGLEGGRNAAGCTGTEQNGIVPWRALGLSETDASDGWDRRLTYRLDVRLGADGGMDMSWCDPAGTEAGATPRACNVACTSATLGNCTPPSAFLNKGLVIQNVAGTQVMAPPATGAAYVVISHGESGGGAYLYSGQVSVSTLTDGTEEQKNYANLALQPYYVDDTLSDVSGATHFDDVVSRPSIMSVISKAGLAPRSH